MNDEFENKTCLDLTVPSIPSCFNYLPIPGHAHVKWALVNTFWMFPTEKRLEEKIVEIWFLFLKGSFNVVARQ